MSGALVALALGLPAAATAQDGQIWGRLTVEGELETEKLDLPAPATITGVQVGDNVHSFCIWSGRDDSVVLCGGAGYDDITGKTLPAGDGYYIFPGPRDPDAIAEVFVEIELQP